VEVRFSVPIQTGPEAYQALLLPAVKRPESGFDHSFPSIAEVKETVELYLNSPSVPPLQIVGSALPLLLSGRLTPDSMDKELGGPKSLSQHG